MDGSSQQTSKENDKNKGTKIKHKLFFLKLFGPLRGIPAKPRDISPRKFVFPGFEGHTELFGPHPFMWKTPTPPEDIRTPKFGFGFLFLPEAEGRVFFYLNFSVIRRCT